MTKAAPLAGDAARMMKILRKIPNPQIWNVPIAPFCFQECRTTLLRLEGPFESDGHLHGVARKESKKPCYHRLR